MNTISKIIDILILVSAALSFAFAGVCRFHIDPRDDSGAIFWLLTTICFILVYIGSKVTH